MGQMGFKQEFFRWRKNYEKQGHRFYKKLSDVVIPVQNFKVGDMVMFTNDYGVVFGPLEVLGFCIPENDRCVYLNKSSYWFAVRPDQLMLASEYQAEQRLEKFKSTAESLGWSVKVYDDEIELSQYSPAGQDFSFSINKKGDYIEQVYEYYDSYDPSAETMLWVDSEGHGKNGAPHKLEDVLADMKAVEKMLETLYDALFEARGKEVEDGEVSC